MTRKKNKPLPMRRPITPRQQEFYEALVGYVKTTGYAATSTAMRDKMGYTSVTAARKMINALELAGWIHPRDVVKTRRRAGAWPVDVPLGMAHNKEASPQAGT